MFNRALNCIIVVCLITSILPTTAVAQHQYYEQQRSSYTQPASTRSVYLQVYENGVLVGRQQVTQVWGYNGRQYCWVNQYYGPVEYFRPVQRTYSSYDAYPMAYPTYGYNQGSTYYDQRYGRRDTSWVRPTIIGGVIGAAVTAAVIYGTRGRGYSGYRPGRRW